MGKIRGRMVTVDGKTHFVQVFNDDDEGWFIVIIVFTILFLIYTNAMIALHMPDEEDLKSTLYREHVKDFATECMLNQERNIWERKGFTKEKSAKGYVIKECYVTEVKKKEEMAKYLGHGIYQVYTSTDITLASTASDNSVTQPRLHMANEYVVTLQTTPKRNWDGTINFQWDVKEIKTIKSRPKQQEIESVLAKWKVQEPMKPSW